MKTSSLIKLVIPIMVFLLGCEKVAIEDEVSVSIQGTVIDSETDLSLNNADITTTLPTNSILSSQDGTYRFDEVPVGNYSIQARKNGYQNNSVSVAGRKNQTAIATLY